MPYPNIAKRAFWDLKDDLRRTRWLRGLGWAAGVLWTLGLIGSACTVVILTFSYIDLGSACQPDGSFRLHPETYNAWSSSGFFQITLGGGQLSFAQAKVIDIAWDIVFGRGGQFILAYLSLNVFRRYLTICMETQPITYQTFRAVFLQNDISIVSAFGFMRSLLWQRPLKSKMAIAFMFLSTGFIIAFPTLASAMSGYDANVGSYLPDYDANFIAFGSFSKVLYVIHDGWRINKTGNHWIIDDYNFDSTYNNWWGEPTLSHRYDTCQTQRRHNPDDLQSTGNPDSVGRGCPPLNAVSAYVRKYGLGGTNNVSSALYDYESNTTGTWINLDPPVLNISAFERPGDDTLGGHEQTNLLLPQSWLVDNETYPISYVEQNGLCQTIGDYQWGFSFLQLFICLILLLIWTIGTYTLWLRAHLTLAFKDRNPSLLSGEHKAVLELASSMQQELSIHHIEYPGLTEKQLNHRIHNELRGGSMSYARAYPELGKYSFKAAISTWFKKEKWWLLAVVLTTPLPATLWMIDFSLWTWTWFFWFGIVCALCIGTTNGSRALIMLFWGILGAVATVAMHTTIFRFSYGLYYSSQPHTYYGPANTYKRGQHFHTVGENGTRYPSQES